ncbi:hypothetical protein BJV77DRAFT_969883, partial [Russula vinacea]
RPSSRPSTSHQHTPYLSSHKRPSSMFEDRDSYNNSWYHPSLEGASGDEEEPIEVAKGNWGRKTAKGARWLRKGKLAAWGPGMEEWEMNEPESVLDLYFPRQSFPITTRITPSTVTLSPLIAPYVTLPAQHLNYTSFVMDRGVTHSFRSPLLEDLERATNGLIEGEAGMKRAFGRLWEVLSKDPDQVHLKDAVIPKREDESEESLSTLRELQDDVREYVERLQEVWTMVRTCALQELQRMAGGQVVQ